MTEVTLHLVNGPYVSVDGIRRVVPEGSKRLLVLVALRGCVPRRSAAELLWPDVEERRAAGNLRSAAWRLRCAELPVLAEQDGALRLDPTVHIDVDQLCRRAQRLVGGGEVQPADLDVLAAATTALDLLPGWYEDWVCGERERVRTQMLQLIDAIAVGWRRAGRCPEAIDAALVAVMADPLRESSQRALIVAHHVEGNLSEARKAYLAYGRLLQTEFGIQPPEQLGRLVGLPGGTSPGTAQTRPSTRPGLVRQS